MKKLTLLLVLAISLKYKSQNSVAYQYDNNGNRTQRYFVGLSFRINPNIPTKDSSKIVQNSTETAMKYGLSVYPNPVKDAVSISINKAGDKPTTNDSDEKAIVYLIDATGKTLAQQKYTGLENTFDMSNLLAGNY